MHDKHSLMTEGSIAGHLLRFAAPLFVGNLFQQLYNTADALIVGNFLGSEALAAVSGTGSLVFMLVSFFVGISAGAGVAISRYFGSREPEKMSRAIHTNIAMCLVSGLILTAAGVAFTPALLRWMDTPENIMPMAASYIRIFFAGSMGMVLYNSLRSIMQAVGDSRNPLRYLIISSVLNVILDIAFIGGLKMGVEGAAYATIIAQFVSAYLCARQLMRTEEDYRVEIRKIGFDLPMLRLIVSYGLPSGIQNCVISFANVLVQSNINAFGDMAMAGCGAYAKIEGFAFLPVNSFVIAITTFVSQNLGAKELDRARKGARFGVWCTIIASELIGALVYLSAPLLIGAFTSEPAAIAYGVQKSRVCALFFFLLATSHGLSAVLRGAGKAVVPMAVMLVFWCIVRVAILELGVPYFGTIDIVYWVYPITWCLSSIVLMIYYLKGGWIRGFEQKT